MEESLKLLLRDIESCYLLAKQELLERERIEKLNLKVREELAAIIPELPDEIIQLKWKKLNSGWRSSLKPGFYGLETAQSEFGTRESFMREILAYLKTAKKTFKDRLDAEGLFIESRSKEDGDMHLLIGQRDGTAEKAHVIIDAKTGEIRVEDNQKEPLEFVKKIETILSLPSGKKIRIVREAIEEIIE
ncbi:MAG: hypothetical protein V4526_00005 [Patescibacteria group bacterium]